MILALINNIAFLVALVAAGQIVISRFQESPLNRQVLLGLLFGGVALLGMANPVDFSPGVLFDGRSIVLSVVGVVGGGVAALIAAVMAALYRYQLGGSGATVGIVIVILSALLGVLARQWWLRRRSPPQPIHYLALGVVVQLVQLAAFTQVPNRAGYAFIEQAWWVLLLLYPLANMLLCVIFRNYEQQLIDQEALSSAKDAVIAAETASMERFHAYFDHSIVGLAITSPGKAWIEVNDALCAMLGYTRDELTRMTWTELTYPEDLAPDLAQFKRMLTGEIKSYALDKRFIHKDGHLVYAHLAASNVRKLDGSVDYVVAMVDDITERKKAEEALRQSDATFRKLFEDSADAILLIDGTGIFVECNEAALTLLKMTREQFLLSAPSRISPEFQPDGRRSAESALEMIALAYSKGLHRFDWVCVNSDGLKFVVEVSLMPIAVKGQTMLHTTWRDVTERKQMEEALRESERQLRESQSIADLGSYVLDIVNGLWKSSEILDRVFGIDTAYVRSVEGWKALIHPDDRLTMEGYFKDHVLGRKQIFDKVYRIVRHDDQAPRWVHGIGKLEFDANGGLLKMFGTIQDITEHKEAEDKIQILAFSDPLTGLPNRRLLRDRLEQAMVGTLRHKHQNALFFIDMDDFKSLNDTLGHDLGDQLLQQIAERVLSSVREGDTVARLGGDEFVVLLEDLDESPHDAAIQAEAVARKIHHALRQNYQLASHSYHSSASIGITLFGGLQREKIEEPLKRAELAMYRAKEAGRDNLRFYEDGMFNAINTRATLEADLHKAVTRSEFLLYYQAQVDHNAYLTGVEALVRWRHPERGLVSPAEFIPVAESSGLILPLGHWVLNTACQQLATWALHPQMGHLTMAVNVSARQFRLPDFVEEVLAVLEATGANPKRLKLELTESLLLDNMKDVITKMAALKAIGVGFSLDDFGTGYSSLAYLKRLPLDQLKIDQGFVRDILTDPNDAAIAKMVIALAESMGLNVIAEGVETQAQRDALDGMGCHFFQGYLFARPLPVDEFEAFAQTHFK